MNLYKSPLPVPRHFLKFKERIMFSVCGWGAGESPRGLGYQAVKQQQNSSFRSHFGSSSQSLKPCHREERCYLEDKPYPWENYSIHGHQTPHNHTKLTLPPQGPGTRAPRPSKSDSSDFFHQALTRRDAGGERNRTALCPLSCLANVCSSSPRYATVREACIAWNSAVKSQRHALHEVWLVDFPDACG